MLGDDTGFDVDQVRGWYAATVNDDHTLVELPERDAAAWAEALKQTIRRCYADDSLIVTRALQIDCTGSDIAAVLVPDAGSVMSGDFAEIIVYLYQAVELHPLVAVGPKRWRLKQDRTKSAPGSDIVQFVLPTWPLSSEEDVLLCTEVKAKATNNAGWNPIAKAIEGSTSDRTSRLGRTLLWLRDRAIRDGLGDVDLAMLNRFIEADSHPTAARIFRAAAVVTSELLQDELAKIPSPPPGGCAILVFSFPGLKGAYEAAYQEVVRSADELTDGDDGGSQ